MKKVLLFFSVLLSFARAGDFSNIVDSTWLQKHKNDKNLVIVDVREADEYNKGHIEGAVNIPANEKLFRGEKLLMPKLSELTKTFGDAGITRDSVVVSYDGGRFYFSTRLYWLLTVLGVKKAAIINKNYAGLKAGHLKTTTKVPKIQKEEFAASVDDTKIASTLQTLVSIGRVTIIDGRRHSDYMGLTSSAKRYGHIPTAINFPSTLNYTKDALTTKIKDWSQLQKLYKDIPKDKPVILYCDDSAEAAFDALILDHFGYKTVVYEGSWFVWGNDEKLPIVNPSKKSSHD